MIAKTVKRYATVNSVVPLEFLRNRFKCCGYLNLNSLSTKTLSNEAETSLFKVLRSVQWEPTTQMPFLNIQVVCQLWAVDANHWLVPRVCVGQPLETLST